MENQTQTEVVPVTSDPTVATPTATPAASLSESPLFDPPKKKLPKKLKFLILFAVSALCVYAFLIQPMMNAGKEFAALGYLYERAEVRDVTVSISSTGTVKPIDSYNVTPLVTGDIVSSPFEEGDLVTAGDLLFQFDDDVGVNALKQAQLSIDRAVLTYNSALESVAPYATGAGIVQTLHVKVGDPVNTGSVIATIADNSNMTVKIPFHSTQAGLFTVGTPGTITLESTMEMLHGTIISISGVDEIGAGNVLLRQVEFRVTNPGAIADGSTATASVITSLGEIFSASNGTFQANQSHTVYAGTSGEISALHVREGSSVSYGTSIATIGGSAANSLVENARIGVESARLSYESAQKTMDNYAITAPISGTVIEKNFKMGDTLDSASLASAGGNLAVIYDMTTLTFEMSVHELDINKVLVGQHVAITADAVEGASFTGVVDKININGVTMAGMTTYPITVLLNDPEGLKPGMNISAEVMVSTVESVLAVPIDAVSRGEDGPYVLVAQAGAFDTTGKLVDPTLSERVLVTLGANDERYIEITSGLTTDDIVLWENQSVNMFASMMSSGPMGGMP